MKRKIVWLVLSCLIVVSLVLTSCAPAVVEEGDVVTPGEGEGEVAVIEEGEGEVVVIAAEGPEMVRDIKGRLVEKPRYGGGLTLYRTVDPPNWDPYRHIDCGLTSGMLFEKLRGGDWSVDRSEWPFFSDYVPYVYGKGYLSESWENPDSLTYIIHVREGVHFVSRPPVNGRELTADDIKYCYDRLTGKGEFEEVGQSPWVNYVCNKAIDYMEVIDRYTVVMHLKYPSPLMPEMFGTEGHTWIYAREAVDLYGDLENWENAGGSAIGPFMIDDYVPDSSLTYVKNPTYWGWDDNFPDNQIPYIDTVKELVMTDLSARLAALRTGKLDNIPGLQWDDWEAIMQTNPELQWIKMQSVCSVVDLRCDLEPYSDIRVRRAMQMAINLQEIADTYYGGTADPYPMMVAPAYSQLFTPLEELTPEAQEAFSFNPTRARELLAEAGYANGFTQVVQLTGESELTDILSAYWGDIGITTEQEILESAVYSANARTRNYTGPRWIWSCGTWMPTEILNYWYGGDQVPWNYSNANDPMFNEILDKVRAEPDAVERDRMMKEGFKLGTELFFYTALPVQVVFNVWQPWVKGYQGERSLGTRNYKNMWARVWIDQDLKAALGH